MHHCKVNLLCRRKVADYWFVIEDGVLAFYDIKLPKPKPKHKPVPCCGLCADAITDKRNNELMQLWLNDRGVE